MKLFFKESFVPVLLVLAIIFGTLAVLRHVAETHSRSPSVIKIHASDVQWAVSEASAADSGEAGRQMDLQNGASSGNKDRVDRALQMASNDSLPEALALVSQLLEENPHHGKSWFAKGLILSRMGRRSDAIAAYEQAVAYTAGAEQATPLFNLAGLYRDAGMDAKAIETYRKAIGLRPDYLEARLNLAILAGRQNGMREEAYRMYDQLIRLDSTYARAYFNRGVLRMDDAATDQAIADFEQTVKLDPKFSKAWYNIGLLESRSKRYEDAAAAYESAISADPKNMKARLNLAVVLGRMDRYEEAVEIGESIVGEDPTYAEAWFNLAIGYTRLKQLDKAKATYEKVLKLESSNARAWQNLGVVYARLKDSHKAIECYKEALAIVPEDATPRYNLALEYKRTGNFGAALEEGMKVYRLDPSKAKTRNLVRTIATQMVEKNPSDKKAQEVLREVPEGKEGEDDASSPE